MLVTLSLFVFRKQVACLFTTDEEVIVLLESALPFLSLSYFPDAAQGLL
jgi:Na+-driven multidrug efflux pump